MEPTYYLLKNKRILRMESNLSTIPAMIKNELLEESNPFTMNQEQANNRVLMFRDTIIEYDELLAYAE